MDQIVNFITENLWLIIVGAIFLSGFSKSKKKKGPPVNDEIPTREDYDFDMDAEEEEKTPWDDLPIPDTIKKAMKHIEDEDRPFKQTKPQPKPQSQMQPQMPPRPVESRHFDNPWSGEGNEFPHQEVRPMNHVQPEYGSNGKALSKNVVTPQGKPSYVLDIPTEAQVKTKIQDAVAEKKLNRNAYAPKPINLMAVLSQRKMREAVIMAEIIGKPKALKHGK